MNQIELTCDRKKYFELLSKRYPSERSLIREIINLSAILDLPKGTEHFMSDLHGEYEAFLHILNNCSGVIREKIKLIYSDTLSKDEQKELCTLIYYPQEKLSLLKKEHKTDALWYKQTLERMLEVARVLSSKYTRSKARKAMPEDYAYIIDELLHAQKDEDDNQVMYHENILESVIKVAGDDFLISLASMIKRLAVDHLHIVGDIFDRGPCAEKIVDLLMGHHSLDIEWGNHDILWMGAACGSDACIASVVRNCVHYNTTHTLENGYGISLVNLILFAQRLYPDKKPLDAALQAITVIKFKLEGQVILRNPEYDMEDRLLLSHIDKENATVKIGSNTYPLSEKSFPTLELARPYELTKGEKEIVKELRQAFLSSKPLQEHTAFLYERGGMYRVYNGNLLYHGCVPLDKEGKLLEVEMFSEKYSGKEYFDMAQTIARRVFYGASKAQKGLDFMWYLYCSKNSPLCGRAIKSFERAYIKDKSSWSEEKNPYYKYYYNKECCEMILKEFGLDPAGAHIINGHTPVRTGLGELPIRADGKLLVIDGGFCRNYHETTGIAGYTLIYNSHGLRLKAHHPFKSVEKALRENSDIHSDSQIVETEVSRVMVSDTDSGKTLKEQIKDLKTLLRLYRSGEFTPTKQ